MSVQQYETEALQEHVDSTPILVNRLDQWRHAVHTVAVYINGYLQVHQSVTSHLEKTSKGITELPTFGGGASASSPSTSQLTPVFQGLQQNVTALLQRSLSTQGAIKQSILPPVETLESEIEKHYKTLKSQGAKGVKEVEKTRADTQKAIEHLGRVSSSFGSKQISTQDDPYLLHRRVEAYVSEQVGRENTQAEAALSVQRNFQALEQHVVGTLKSALSQLDRLNEQFDKGEIEVNQGVTQLFASIDMQAEWETFTKANASQLVPEKNYQRDPQYVTFANKNSRGALPIVQGLLNRKGTVLKNYSQSFYVLTPAGYLYQFKNGDENVNSATPDLALYLPECQISKDAKDLVFKIAGKDHLKPISTRHKYVFRANSASELETWYQGISRLSGNVVETEIDSGDDEEVPTQQLAGASLSHEASSAAAPATTVGTVPVATAQTTPQVATQATPQAATSHVATPVTQSPVVAQSPTFASAGQTPTIDTTLQSPTLQSPTLQSPTVQSPTAQQAFEPVAHTAAEAAPSTNPTDPFKGF